MGKYLYVPETEIDSLNRAFADAIQRASLESTREPDESEFIASIDLRYASALCGFDLPQFDTTLEEATFSCFLDCGKADKSAKAMLTIRIQDSRKRWACSEPDCNQDGDLVALCMFLLKKGRAAGYLSNGAERRAVLIELHQRDLSHSIWRRLIEQPACAKILDNACIRLLTHKGYQGNQIKSLQDDLVGIVRDTLLLKRLLRNKTLGFVETCAGSLGFAGYFFALMRRLCDQALRSQRMNPMLFDELPPNCVEEEGDEERWALCEQLLQEIEDLPPPLKLVGLLMVEGCSIREIVDRLRQLGDRRSKYWVETTRNEVLKELRRRMFGDTDG